jgi:hypothetical protein
MNEKQRRMVDYLKTPEGRRKLSEALLRPSTGTVRTCSAGIMWRWIGRENLLAARFLKIDHERVSVEYDDGIGIRVQGMTTSQFSRWAPELYRRFGFNLRHREGAR